MEGLGGDISNPVADQEGAMKSLMASAHLCSVNVRLNFQLIK